MDNERAIEVLEWWIENAKKAQVVSQYRTERYAHVGTREMNALREREDQTRRVIARVNGVTNLPVIIATYTTGNIVELESGIETAKYALGRLKTDAETRAMLGTAAPTMSADAMHATIWNAASDLWADGHHGQAVARAANFLNAHVQSLIGRTDLADGGLMRQAFSMEPASPDSPRLRWPGKDDDLTVKAMRTGILNFSQGIYAAIRNPATHSIDDLPRQEALEQLAALSVLARWIDGCQVIRA